ncbi:MAG: helix-turn-helix domain-containing protein [Caldisphaeraceae archaeon]|nr:helix-turn-helix domain-containing protein [Caldisphaeraceae archaeon]MEB3797407.1 helix-turn-helix domain-containing protein [Caldisphaeraceae archaeon]
MECHCNTKEAYEILGIVNRALRRWIKDDRIRAVNIGGRWRYLKVRLRGFLIKPVEEIIAPKIARVVIYACVSKS